MNRFLIIMGVSGSGKTTIGRQVARRLGAAFFDADDFHPAENIKKMAEGNPLNDLDREPWLNNLADMIKKELDEGKRGVLACSALKKEYRDKLRVGEEVLFVFLQGEYDLIWERIADRDDHFMKADMLRSQFKALEPPTDEMAMVVSVDQTIKRIVEEVLERLEEKKDEL